MKISTEIHSASKLVGMEKAVEYVGKAGFDAWDFTMYTLGKYNFEEGKLFDPDHPLNGNEYIKFARRLKQIGLDNGVVCNQSHAPFPHFLKDVMSYYKRAFECTAEAGGKVCVVHPDVNKGPKENAEMYLKVLPYAKECGIKLAAENLWNWDKENDHALFGACSTPESFIAHLDAVEDSDLVACLDIGHAEMTAIGTSAVEMIKALKDRIKVLHIHDNDKIHDNHQIPFSMNVDFVPIVKELKKVGYDGYFTLEADGYMRHFAKEDVPSGLKDLAAAARKLADMFDEI